MAIDQLRCLFFRHAAYFDRKIGVEFTNSRGNQYLIW